MTNSLDWVQVESNKKLYDHFRSLIEDEKIQIVDDWIEQYVQMMEWVSNSSAVIQDDIWPAIGKEKIR